MRRCTMRGPSRRPFTPTNTAVSPTAAAKWKEIHDLVVDGMSLANAMAQSPDTFPRVYVAMVEAGETGGFLDVVLAQIAEFQSRDKEIRTNWARQRIYHLMGVLARQPSARQRPSPSAQASPTGKSSSVRPSQLLSSPSHGSSAAGIPATALHSTSSSSSLHTSMPACRQTPGHLRKNCSKHWTPMLACT